MKFKCPVNEIAAALAVVTRALPSRSASPVMEGVLLTTTDSGLRLTCTDLSLSITKIIPSEIEEDGMCVLPGKLFSEMVRKLADGTFSLKVKEKTAEFGCGSSKMKLTAFDASEFPALPEFEEKTIVTLPKCEFREMISRTSFAAAIEETRPILQGCLLEVSENIMTMVALDGFRLALRRYQSPQNIPNLSAVIPAKVLGEIAKLVEDSEDEISLKMSEAYMAVQMEETYIVSRLMEGEFIKYRDILPKTSQTTMIINRTEMENAIDRASLMAREGKTNLVKLHIEEGNLIINSNAEMGDVHEEIPAETSGRVLDIAFNVKYLSEMLRAVDEEEVKIEFSTNVSPCVLVPQSGDEYLYMALPVRVFVS